MQFRAVAWTRLAVGLVLALGAATVVAATPGVQDRPVFAPKPELYRDDWIDFNKKGRKDTYEDRQADIDARSILTVWGPAKQPTTTACATTPTANGPA